VIWGLFVSAMSSYSLGETQHNHQSSKGYSYFGLQDFVNPSYLECWAGSDIAGLIGIFLSGFFINTLNPSVFLFWFAWTSAINAEALSVSNPAQYKFLFFACCLSFVLASDMLKVFLSEKLRAKLTPTYLKILNKIAGIFLIGFGIVLLYVALK
jgi:threonine/homoserine/homoserine lactone efflux protein